MRTSRWIEEGISMVLGVVMRKSICKIRELGQLMMDLLSLLVSAVRFSDVVSGGGGGGRPPRSNTNNTAALLYGRTTTTTTSSSRYHHHHQYSSPRSSMFARLDG